MPPIKLTSPACPKCGSTKFATPRGWVCPNNLACGERVTRFTDEYRMPRELFNTDSGESGPCESCDGTAVVECPECEGRGDVYCCFCDHSHDCDTCDGVGTVPCDKCKREGVVELSWFERARKAGALKSPPLS